MPLRYAKPMTLGLLTKPYTQADRHRMVVVAMGYFELGDRDATLIPEFLGMPRALGALPAGVAIDALYPKARGEVLMAATAHAPDQRPIGDMTVRLRLGPIDKTLRVRGDRVRNRLGGYGEPRPFTQMPLDWQHAYGGAKHRENRVGIGYTGSSSESTLPNIDYPNDAIRSGDQRTPPAGFGPRDIACADRQALFGTMDKKWQQRFAPNLPADFNPGAFNAAPLDQQIDHCFVGGETYCLDNLHARHPQLRGVLPQLRVRIFAQRTGQTAQQAQETEVALDTVWFLPEADLGVCVYRAQIDCEDCDGEDIEAIMAAYEAQNDTPRSLTHYRQVLALRTELATRHLHAFNDAPLIPEVRPEVIATRLLQRQCTEAAKLAAHQAELDEMEAEFWAKADMPKPADYQPPKAELPPLPTVDLNAVLKGEVDLGELIQQAKTLSDDVERKGKQQLEDLKQRQHDGDMSAMPQPEPKKVDEIATEALQRACGPVPSPFADLLAESSPLTDTQRAQLTDGARQLEQAQLKSRAMATTADDATLPPEVAAQLGALVRAWLHDGASLIGRDLRGADLHGLNFAGCDLSRCDLAGTNLRGCCFDDAHLVDARLTGASLDDASLRRADLSGANLNRVSALRACLEGAQLHRAALLEIRLDDANLRNLQASDLTAIDANWRGAQLDGAKLSKCTLLRLDAANSQWIAAQLSQCVIYQATLTEARFAGAQLDRVVLCGAQAERSQWHGARFEKALLNLATLTGADFSGILATLSSWRDATLTASDWRGANLLRCDLSEARFAGADLRTASFAHSLLMNAKLGACDARDADFFQALLRKADLRATDLRGANLVRALDAEACYDNAKLDKAQRTAFGEAV